MTPHQTLQTLLTTATQAATDHAQAQARTAARLAWAEGAVAALRTAHDRVAEAWERIFDDLPEDLDDDALADLPGPPEQEELDRLLAEINAVRDHDRWPREL